MVAVPPPLSSLQERALQGLFLGPYIGGGIARRVFTYSPSPSSYVVKIEDDEARDFQNVAEWAMWQSAKAPLKRWLAPCVWISPCGLALLQARCEPCPKHLIPARAPKVLGDLHADNWGLYESKPVVLDYGRHLALTLTANAKTMKNICAAT